MKLVIFAGGIGTRLWPLSRENSPKQFDRIFGGKSTLELALNRISSFGWENIFIQTQEKYIDAIREQAPNLPKENIIIEPERRNVGPAVCFAAQELKNRGISGALAILWADHLMERENEFIKSLIFAEKILSGDPNKLIFMAERPRFANNNLGWINVGKMVKDGEDGEYYNFLGWKYRPEQEECERMFKDGNYLWNPGYCISTVDFMIESYKKFSPEIYQAISEKNYSLAPSIHFDSAIAEKIATDDVFIIKTNMGWSDPGTLYALKEALEKSAEKNVSLGEVAELDSSDCLLYNLEEGKVLAAVGLKGMVVVNTSDALIVVPKDEVKKITKLIDQMKTTGLEKYL